MMSDQVQTYLQNKEKANTNKILDDDNFISDEVFDTSDIVSRVKYTPVQDQTTTYNEQKQELQNQKANRTAVQILSQEDPDENAEAQQLAKDYQTHYNPEFILPESIVKNNKDHIQSRVAQRKLTTTLSNSPMLLRWLGNPKNAAVASDDVAVLAEIEAGLNTVGRIMKRGGLKLQQTGLQVRSDFLRYSSEQYGLTFLDRYKLARGIYYDTDYKYQKEAVNRVFEKEYKSEAERQIALKSLGTDHIGAFFEALAGTTVDAFNKLNTHASQKRDIHGAVILQQRAAEIAERLEGVEGAEGVDEHLRRFIGGSDGEPLSLTDAISITGDILTEDPVGFFKMIGQLSLESAVSVAPAIAAAQITRNPGVGAVTMGGTSYMMESAFEAMEFFRERGIDFSDPKAVEALLADKDLMRDLDVRRHLKALPIALLDTLSAGLASKVFANNPVADLALQSLVQSAAGGLGEALSQNLVHGQVNWGTVLLEAFAEFGTAPVEVGGIGMRKLGNLRNSADEAEGAAEALKEVSEGVQQSATRERANDVFKDFAQELAEDSGVESLYVPAEEFFKFLDENSIPAVELAEKLPSLDIQDLDRARVSNEDVKIPFAEYMANIAGSDIDMFIQENAKFDPEGMTLREAANFRDNEILEEAKVSALQEKARKLSQENERVLSEVRNAVEEQLRQSGKPEEFAKREAEIFAAFYEAVAQRSGKKVSEIVEKYKVPLVRSEKNESPLNDASFEDVGVSDLANVIESNDAVGVRGKGITEAATATGKRYIDKYGAVGSHDWANNVAAETRRKRKKRNKNIEGTLDKNKADTDTDEFNQSAKDEKPSFDYYAEDGIDVEQFLSLLARNPMKATFFHTVDNGVTWYDPKTLQDKLDELGEELDTLTDDDGSYTEDEYNNLYDELSKQYDKLNKYIKSLPENIKGRTVNPYGRPNLELINRTTKEAGAFVADVDNISHTLKIHQIGTDMKSKHAVDDGFEVFMNLEDSSDVAAHMVLERVTYADEDTPGEFASFVQIVDVQIANSKAEAEIHAWTTDEFLQSLGGELEYLGFIDDADEVFFDSDAVFEPEFEVFIDGESTKTAGFVSVEGKFYHRISSLNYIKNLPDDPQFDLIKKAAELSDMLNFMREYKREDVIKRFAERTAYPKPLSQKLLESTAKGLEFEQQAHDRILYQLPGLHSTTVKAITSLKQKKGTGAQFWNMIKKTPGVKKDELEWMGLEQWLKDQKKITHDEIMEYVDAHKIDIDETIARGTQVKSFDEFQFEFENDYDSYRRMEQEIEEFLQQKYAGSDLIDPRENDDFSEFDELQEQYYIDEYEKYTYNIERPERFTSDPDGTIEDTKFEENTQPGGKNYTEMSLQISGTPLKNKTYHGAHFGPENTFAHARYKTRSVGGGSVMHIEEIQSDLHAHGRDEGYEKQVDSKEVEKLEEAIHKAKGDMRNAEAAAVELFNSSEYNEFVDKVLRSAPVDKMNKSSVSQAVNNVSRFDTYEKYLEHAQTEHKNATEHGGDYAQLDRYRRLLVAESMTREMFHKLRYIIRTKDETRLRVAEAEGKLHALFDGVLSAPFKGTGWLELTIKRLLAKAVEDGFDAISFNRGIDIANVSHGGIFDLSDGVHEWDISKNDEGETRVYTELKSFGSLIDWSPNMTSLKLYAPEAYEQIKTAIDSGETSGTFNLSKSVTVPRDGFAFEYDQQIPRFLNKYLKQWGAKLEYRDGIVTRIGSNEGVPFVRITPEMRESIQKAGQFYQGPRGRINIPADFDGQAVIDLFKNHDNTSFMHESSHFALAMLMDVANNAEPDSELVQMYNDTKKWWFENAEAVAKDGGEGITDKDVQDFLNRGTTYDDAKDKAVYVGLHEQWARGFEKYLMEGKAPNSRLRAVFEMFRKIFTKIYGNLKALDVELNDDIIKVFDRLVAVDDHVETATEDQNFNMMVDNPEKMGVTPEDFEELQERFKQAQLETLGETINKAMEGVRRARSKERKEYAASIKKEVEDEVNSRPIYRAIEWLGNKRWLGDEDDRKVPDGMRLNKEQLIEREGKEILRKLPRGEKGFRVYTPGGMDIDEAAGWFGYDSGDALVKDMLSTPKRKTAIKDEIAARVAMQFGDGNYEGIETASEVLATSDKRGSFIAQELKLLNKSLGDMRLAGNLTLKYAREVARESIRTMKTRDAVDAKKFLAAERREANKAQEALKLGDTQRAAGHKYSQLFNFALHAEAKKVVEEQAKLQRLGKRLSKKSTRKKLDPGYMEAIDNILDLYDFRKRSNAQERRQEARNEGLLKYVEMMKAQGRENELAIPQHVLDNAKVRPIKSLTVDEMRGVYASLKNVENTARRSKRLIDKKRQRELDDVAASIEEAFQKNVKRKPPDRIETDAEKRNRRIKQSFSAVLTADTMLREIDGFEDGGAVYENLKLGIDEAQARLENRREQAANDLEALYGVYTRQEQDQMSVSRRHTFLGGTYAKWDLISIVLNMGNKDNLERLTNPKTRGAFTKAQLDYVINQMDKKDLDFVQSVWDYINTFFPEIAEREMRTTGVKPDKVEATALQTPHGEYKGGYYPIKYDSRNSDMVRDETNEEIIQNMRMGRFGKAQTRNGHTQSRVESSGRPIRLDLSVLHGHVNAVLHDLELSEEVTNAWRVLQHPKVKNAFLDHGKQVEHEALELWVKDVASGHIAATDGVSWTARKLRSGFTISKLAFNLSTVAIQVTGLGQSAVTIGKKNMYKGMKEWSKDPVNVGAKVAELSDFMRRRETTFNKDVYDMVGNIKTGPKMGRYQRFMNEVMEPAAFYAMQKVQYNVVDVPTWLGAYQQGLELFEGSEEKAIHHADRAVARSQASGIFGDRSGIERGTLSPTTQQSDFIRLFTTLGSYMFAKANVAYERTKKTDFKDPEQILNWLVDMVLLFTTEAVLYNLIKGTAPVLFGGDADEDEDGWAEFLAKETAFSVLGTMPFIRDAASAYKGYDAGTYSSIIKTLTVPLTQLSQGEIDKAAVKSMINAGGMLFHLPSTQMNRMIDAEWRRQEGDEVSPIEYLMGRSR